MGELKEVKRMGLKGYLKLIRFDHEIFLIIGVLIGEIMVSTALGNTNILPETNILILSLLVPVFIGMASFALNDLLDLGVDIKNKRKDRPLVSKKVSKNSAILTAVLGFPIGIFLSYYINISAFKIAIAFTILGFLYSVWLKNIAVLGNATIASTMAIPFIFGNYVIYPKMSLVIIILSLMAFLMGFGREIFKSIQDMKGDKKAGRETLPILIGPTGAAGFGAYFIIFSIFVSAVPFIYVTEYKFDPYYIIPIIVADILLLYSVFQAFKLKGFEKIRRWTLLAMLFGLIGFLLGALV